MVLVVEGMSAAVPACTQTTVDQSPFVSFEAEEWNTPMCPYQVMSCPAARHDGATPASSVRGSAFDPRGEPVSARTKEDPKPKPG